MGLIRLLLVTCDSPVCKPTQIEVPEENQHQPWLWLTDQGWDTQSADGKVFCPSCGTSHGDTCTCPGPYTVDTTCPVHGDD